MAIAVNRGGLGMIGGVFYLPKKLTFRALLPVAVREMRTNSYPE
jgi:hypothetical protein